MMAAIIFAISLVTLFMFFVSYCRSMMATAARQELSEEVRDVTGIGETASRYRITTGWCRSWNFARNGPKTAQEFAL